ncbi:MAG: radical SAM protein, partial [Myxococcota bacterium]
MPHPDASLPTFRPDVVPTPRIVFWETTGACNLRCVHCRREWTDAPPNELTTDEVKSRLIDAIADANWHSILVFSGGEPLMRNDLFELIAHTAQRGLIPAVATNATMIDDAIAKRFAELGVSRVSVSLDGASAQTHDAFRGLPGSFDDALRGIRALRNAGVDVQVNVTFTKANRDEAPEMLDLVQEIGACAM